MRQSSTNFWGGIVNRLLSSVDLVGVASGNYIGAAAETAISQVYALIDRDMSIEERRALARDLDHLKRYPDDPKNAQVRKQVELLDKKKRDVLVGKQLAKAKEALNKGDDEHCFMPKSRPFSIPSREMPRNCDSKPPKLCNSAKRRAGRVSKPAPKKIPARSSKPTRKSCWKRYLCAMPI